MPYVIGTDEAGYGPNLGPLCVGATVWEVDDGIDPATLYKPLRRCVTNSVNRAGKNRVVWADSKAVYKNGCGMDHLERGVLTALALAGRSPSGWSDLWDCLEATSAGESNQQPWHDGYSASLPLWMDGEDGTDWMSGEAITEFSNGLKVQLAESGVRLVGVLCRAVFASTFNEMVAASNKADTLSRITLGLVADAMAMIPSQRVHVFCDKHGGRDYYLPLLQNQFSDDWIEVRQESGQASTYRFGGESNRVDIGFYVGGERFLPIALASMTAKYLRETAMRPFNEFWLRHVPGIKPTAGYPTDSWRFKKQIAAAQQELEIADRILWRER
jgi:ribonuclease HII